MTSFSDGDNFKIGLFATNTEGGQAFTTVEERWRATWEGNLELAKLADEAGIDFFLHPARYLGYGGETNPQGTILDATTLTAAMLACTERVSIFTTIHTAFMNPAFAAKQLATLDAIGPGRAGLNIVAGWNKREYDMLGVDLPQEHVDRYGLAQEWFDVVSRLLTSSEPLDFDGEYFRHTGAVISPRPALPIPIINAGSSVEGRDFGARNSDFVFTVAETAAAGADIVKGIQENSLAKYGRKAGVMTSVHVVCRPTHDEAIDYARYYAEEHGDMEAAKAALAGKAATAKTFTPEQLKTFLPRMTAGSGSTPVYGSPDEVADQIAAYAEAGFAGVTLGFIDFLPETEYFAAEVLPRLKARGVKLSR